MISTLIIKQVRLKDAGRYECQATQGKASAKSGVYLTVMQGRSPLIVSHMLFFHFISLSF